MEDFSMQANTEKLDNLKKLIKTINILNKLLMGNGCNKVELPVLLQYLEENLTGQYSQQFYVLFESDFQNNKINSGRQYVSYLEKLRQLIAPASIDIKYDLCV